MMKNKIRILHVAQAAGGVDRYIRMLLKYLDKEKFENILVCSRDFHEEDYRDLVDFLSNKESYEEIAKKVAQKYNCELVLIPTQKEHYKFGGTIIQNAGPCEWLGLVKDSCAVVTDSFHGSIFSLVFKKDFYVTKRFDDALGADTYVINNKPNGTNINTKAGSTHIEGLQKFVVEKGLDVGFAYDGDADRCLCVDEKGNVITGDHILYIYGCYMKERGKLLTNTVVTTVMSNFGLYKAFDEQGIGYAKTAVGDKYVYEYMAKNGCRIGGEQSGHIIFSKYASTGDGILTSLKMMEVMLAKKKPMSELAAPLKIYPQVLENVRVTDKKAAQNDLAVQEAVKKVSEALGDTGRILVRESGTEPVVRVMVEAPDHDTCQKYVSEVVDVIRDRGYSL